jgi:hypothetical protein
MPPRRSARVAAVAEQATSALAPLPLSVVLHIFSLLPVDVRLRCLEVCRGWRSVLLERSLWTRLDVSGKSGVARATLSDRLLLAVSARAGGELQTLDVSDFAPISDRTLLAVTTANAGSLTELRSVHDARTDLRASDPACIEGLLAAAPRLRALHANVLCGSAHEAERLLLGEGALQPLRVHTLCVDLHTEDDDSVQACAAAITAHASLEHLMLHALPRDALGALDALVGAAVARGVRSIYLSDCQLSPAVAQHLARLLRSPRLTTLFVANRNVQLLDAAAAATLRDALRDSSVTALYLCRCGLWRDPAAAALLFASVAAQPGLAKLCLQDNAALAAQRAAAGAALGALLAADTPLQQLDVGGCALGDAGLRPLLDALARNTHLEVLNAAGNGMSAGFAARWLLPAVRAASPMLLKLMLGEEHAEALQAEALIDAAREALAEL